MKTLLVAAAAVAALGAALPAAAQTRDRNGHAAQIEVRRVGDHFDRGEPGRFLSSWEARRLEEPRRFEWRLRQERFHEGFRDSGYGYRR